MSKYLQDYVDVSALHKLDALSQIIGLIKAGIELVFTQDGHLEVDASWRTSIDVYDNTLDLCVSKSDLLPGCRRERAETDILLAKIIGVVPTPSDIFAALPLTEPELCVLIFGCYDANDEVSVEWEFYVRDKFLKLPSSKSFRDALAAEKLRLA